MLVFTVYIRGARFLQKNYLFVIISLNEISIPFLQKSPASVFFLIAFAIRLKCSVVSFF